MQRRVEFAKVAPDGIKAMSGLEMYVRRGGLEALPLKLAKVRASQMNGCAYCIDMHTKDARGRGRLPRVGTRRSWLRASGGWELEVQIKGTQLHPCAETLHAE